MRTLLFSLLLAVASIVQAQVTSLSAADFKKAIDRNDGILLDTRSQGEYARGHIAGSRMIDLQDPNVSKTLLALPKDKPLYLYCYSGARSMSIASFLMQNGYTKVYNMQRGLIDWSNNGLPLVTGNTAPSQPQPDAMSVADFQKLLTEKGFVFVDFYAPWCAPCKQMMPMMEELKNEYKGKIKMVKINSDASKDAAQKAGVTGVPYLLLYKNGKAIYTKDGLAQKDELKKVFDSNLRKK